MPGDRHRRLALITPVLDDWESFVTLVSELDTLFAARDVSLRILAIDDGSRSRLEVLPALAPDSCIVGIEVLHLALNVGHQRAIAVGLTQVVERDDVDAVLVMDGDGEDRPADIPLLLAAAEQNTGHVILAQRAQRSESRAFRVFYSLYKMFFRLLTGEAVSFGNFCLIPIAGVRHLVHMAELWNNFPISILRSGLRRNLVPTARGRRYTGTSKMELTTLIVHGMSAMSVYTEVIFVRLLLASAPLAILTVIGIAVAVVLKLTLNFATPGWTTTVVGVLVIVLAQMVSVVTATALMVLSARRVRPMVPVLDCKHLVASVEELALVRSASRIAAAK